MRPFGVVYWSPEAIRGSGEGQCYGSGRAMRVDLVSPLILAPRRRRLGYRRLPRGPLQLCPQLAAYLLPLLLGRLLLLALGALELSGELGAAQMLLLRRAARLLLRVKVRVRVWVALTLT